MRRTKRFASFALAACMGVSLLVNVPAGTVSAAEPEETVTSPVEGMTEETVPDATGTDAEALDEEQEVVYDASDADEDGFVWLGTTIVGYVGEGGDVKIPDTCTEIAGDAFINNSNLTSVEIPESVTMIESHAFGYCKGLVSVKISAQGIRYLSFSNCKNLTSVEISESVTYIEERVFENCSSLEKIIVASENETYNSNNECNAIIETKTNTLIAGCKNTKIPDGVTSIGSDAFSGCTGLTSIEIPFGVTSIESYAFSGCNLTSIKIPASVTSIAFTSFNSGGVEEIIVDPENKRYNSNGDCNAIIERNTLVLGCKNTKIPNGDQL